ncbi:hypothetical protein PC110_g3546 [Phytophthora cactorum]|uniref:Uncharacterized protein n=1 Tax=Phytophthora cactorum TaxID=29920 RepID=A0A329SXF4_9STRA|nr:hypothetical protein PC110_g3546 [Phytophthora cactorum]
MQSCLTSGPVARAQPRTANGNVEVDTPRVRGDCQQADGSGLPPEQNPHPHRTAASLPRQASFPRNHPSASAHLGVLRANIRKEQDLFRCIVVDADIIDVWSELFISPFGIVDNRDGEPRVVGRVIHGLSFPEDNSVNSNTDPSELPRIAFEHCSSVAREILRCKRKYPGRDVMVMTGDVASAYRNACPHRECVYMFAGYIPEDNAIVIDMFTAFGWTGSAGTYSILGGAVAFIHGSTGDGHHPFGFYNYHWVDDLINVTADVGSRCADIEWSLRHAMTSVMGLTAVNNHKFTSWSTRQKILGIIFDTKCCTVAMPDSKINKAQQLHILSTSSLNGIPLEYFNALPEPDIIVTDTSVAGACALVPAQKLALRYEFSADERLLIQAFNSGSDNAFDINYCEMLACAFAI